MELYQYSFAGLSVALRTPLPLRLTEESAPFLHLGTEDFPFDHEIILSPCDTLPPCPQDTLTVLDNTYARKPDGMGLVYHALFPGEEPVVLVEDQPGKTLVHYLPAGESWATETFGLMNLIELDNLLLCHNRLMLHASFVSWQGQGILFSAPSGTGKSTQADLWEKYQKAQIVNGDRAGLSQKDGQWYAHGLPFSGSSRIFRKESAPLRLLVCLSQGKENVATRLPPVEALRRLFPEVNLRRWDESSVTRATGLLMELIGEVPVYHLSCRPDEEATEVIRKLLD